MEVLPVDTAPLIGKISEAGVLASFMFLVILGLVWLVKYLIQRNEAQQKVVQDALVNNTAAVTQLVVKLDAWAGK